MSRRCHGAAMLFTALLARPALAGEEDGGGLVGWVENTQGAPVAGAVISIFGKGIRGGNLVTLSDSSGQFILPSLPAGSYTLRALGNGHQPAPARQVTVLPNQDSLFTVSLAPLGERLEAKAEPEPEPEPSAAVSAREVRWLLRHKRRSILEDREEGPVTPGRGGDETSPAPSDFAPRTALYVPDLTGTFEVVTSPATLGVSPDSFGNDLVPTSLGVVRLGGRLASGHWSLGGLVTERESTTWRVAAEFVVEPAAGHELTAGTGYGTRYLPALGSSLDDDRLDYRSNGVIFIRDRWQASEKLSATVGVRYGYLGFLDDRNHLDPSAALEYRATPTTRLRGSFAVTTIGPGGDLLTLSTLASGPTLTLARMDAGLKAEKARRSELAVDRVIGATTVGAQLFYEDVQDQLVNAYDGALATPSLRILNGGRVSAQGLGVSVSRHFGEAVSGSLAYTYGQSHRDSAVLDDSLLRTHAGTAALAYREGGFHDVVARVETFIEGTDTRLSAYYRINALDPESDGGKGGSHVQTNTRFDIQLSQGLPFLQGLTRAEWDVLVAVRNLFYETSEGAVLDEVSVLRPPKRVLGGISVRF